MGDGTILVTILGSALAAVMGAATYFIQKWIASVDETLKEHNTVIRHVSSQVSSLEQGQGNAAESLKGIIHSEGRDTRAAIAGLLEIRKEVEVVKNFVVSRTLTVLEKEQLGKVVVIEKVQNEQGKLITKLYETLKLVIEKSSRPK